MRNTAVYFMNWQDDLFTGKGASPPNATLTQYIRDYRSFLELTTTGLPIPSGAVFP